MPRIESGGSEYPGPEPLIGITGRRDLGSVLGGPSGFRDAAIDIYFEEYASSVAAVGGIPVHIPFGIEAERIVDRLDGLVLAGGEDIDPRRYAEAPGPHTLRVDPLRDELEMTLFLTALRRSIPVLGICRGQQIINVSLGGTLVQHLEQGTGESHASWAYPRAHRVHSVVFVEDSIAASIYGVETYVNSFHHQAVRELGAGLRATGRARDGVIESLEHTSAPVLAVQWHPEALGVDPAFQWLVNATNEREARI